MLSDKERKIANILSNFSLGRYNRMPTITELRKKTGLREEVIRRNLASLADKRAIYWDGSSTGSIKMDPGWRKLY